MVRKRAAKKAAGPSKAAPAGGRIQPAKEFHLGLIEIAVMAGLSLLIWLVSPTLAYALREWSYAGAFILAFLSSATVFVPAGPLQLAIVMLGRQLDPVWLGIIAGIGSGIGELSGYFVGQGSTHLLRTRNQTLKWLLALQQGLLRRFAGPGVFLLAAVPNPFFDFAGIAAGLMGMKWHEFLFWCISGRILRFLILAYLGAWSLSWIV